MLIRPYNPLLQQKLAHTNNEVHTIAPTCPASMQPTCLNTCLPPALPTYTDLPGYLDTLLPSYPDSYLPGTYSLRPIFQPAYPLATTSATHIQPYPIHRYVYTCIHTQALCPPYIRRCTQMHSTYMQRTFLQDPTLLKLMYWHTS